MNDTAVPAPGGILHSLAAELGGRLLSDRVIGIEVNGEGFISGHELEMLAADGRVQRRTVYIETHPSGGSRDGVLTMRNDETGDEVAVWLYPKDPALPALPAAVYPDAATALLNGLGLDAPAVTLSLVAYRPGKRAVVRADTGTGTRIYLKVVAPGLVGALQARYQAWHAAGLPVPGTLGWSDDGLVAFSTIDGVLASTMIPALAADERFLDQVELLSAGICRVVSDRPARASLASRLGWYEQRLTRLLPERAEALDAVCRRIEAVLRSGGRPAIETVHGDLHLGQIFVHADVPSRITGIIDIDTAGWGDPADDAAALYAHLVVSALFHQERREPEVGRACDTLAARWKARWARHPDPGFAARAHAIAATHLLAHALGSSVRTDELIRRAAGLVGSAARAPAHLAG